MTINNKFQPLYIANDNTITTIENNSSNLQFCEVNNSLNTISAVNLLNQNTNEDLNLAAFDGSSINPIIKINNTHQHVNIMSNLNVASNLNVTGILKVSNSLPIFPTIGGVIELEAPISTIAGTTRSFKIINDILDNNKFCAIRGLENNTASVGGIDSVTLESIDFIRCGRFNQLEKIQLNKTTDVVGNINIDGNLNINMSNATDNILKLKTEATSDKTSKIIFERGDESNPIYTQIYNRKKDSINRTTIYSKNNIEFILSNDNSNITDKNKTKLLIYNDENNSKAVDIKGDTKIEGNLNIDINLNIDGNFSVLNTENTTPLDHTAFINRIELRKPIYMVNEPIFLQRDNRHYIQGITTPHTTRDNIDGVEISGFGGNKRSVLRVVQTQWSPPSKTIIEMYGDMINCHTPIWMNTNAINFYKDEDENHQILHSFGKHPNGVAGELENQEMNGILIRALGADHENNLVPFCRFQSSLHGSDTNVMDLYKNNVKIYSDTQIDGNLNINMNSDTNNILKLKTEATTSSDKTSKIIFERGDNNIYTQIYNRKEGTNTNRTTIYSKKNIEFILSNDNSNIAEKNKTQLVIYNDENNSKAVDIKGDTQIDGNLNIDININIDGNLKVSGDGSHPAFNGGSLNRIEFKKPIYMFNEPIYLHKNDAFYIKWYGEDYSFNGTEIKGFRGVSLGGTEGLSSSDVADRAYTNNNVPSSKPSSHNYYKTHLETYKDKVKIYTNLDVSTRVNRQKHDRTPVTDDIGNYIKDEIFIKTGEGWKGYNSNLHTPIMELSSHLNGRVTIHSWDDSAAELHVEGSIKAGSNTSITSDDRFKTNEISLTNCLQTILKLQPEFYTKTNLKTMTRNVGECPTYIDDNGIVQQDIDNWPKETYTVKKASFLESGLIAQDTYNNAPELRHLITISDSAVNNPENFNEEGKLIENVVDENGNASYLALNYVGIIPYLIGAIKEMNTTINTLQTENNELKSIIDKLKNANSFEEFKQTF